MEPRFRQINLLENEKGLKQRGPVDKPGLIESVLSLQKSEDDHVILGVFIINTIGNNNYYDHHYFIVHLLGLLDSFKALSHLILTQSTRIVAMYQALTKCQALLQDFYTY